MKPLIRRIGLLPEVEGEWECCNGFRFRSEATHPASVDVCCPWCGDGRRVVSHLRGALEGEN